MSDYQYDYQENDVEQGEPLTLKDAINILKVSGGDYFAARKELFQLEAKEASHFFGQKLVIVAILAVVAVFSYFLLWAAVITAVSPLLTGMLGGVLAQIGAWPIVATLVLIPHLFVMLVLVKKLKQKADFELFQMTKSEIQKDKQWLEENK